MAQAADCACVYVGYVDGPDFHWARVRVARKPNRCGECCRVIDPGEQYEHEQQKYEDEWYSNVTCVDCLSIRNSFFCDGWLFGSVLDNLQEHIEGLNGEVASECLVPLTPRARAIVCDLMEDAWEHLNEDEEDDAHGH